ncbi:pyruvate kinase alpha/beta domain-containing protein [Bradyrhizobium sp. vgs-9]|uniref:pyruvate kinase alpha/beta domain-containing protein n=1 Tax=Bradyrhizobium sp. vgs-9 TaxID=208389 RepID=UPI0035D4D384
MTRSTYRSLIEASRADVGSTPSHAAAAAGANLAAKIGAKVIIGFTAGGTTAARISRSRPPVPILALTPDEKVARRMTHLVWRKGWAYFCFKLPDDLAGKPVPTVWPDDLNALVNSARRTSRSRFGNRSNSRRRTNSEQSASSQPELQKPPA